GLHCLSVGLSRDRHHHHDPTFAADDWLPRQSRRRGPPGHKFVNGTLEIFLQDSRVQISQTGAGNHVSLTPYTVESFPLTPLFQKRCLDVPSPPSDCDRLEEAMLSRVTYHTITPELSS